MKVPTHQDMSSRHHHRLQHHLQQMHPPQCPHSHRLIVLANGRHVLPNAGSSTESPLQSKVQELTAHTLMAKKVCALVPMGTVLRMPVAQRKRRRATSTVRRSSELLVTTAQPLERPQSHVMLAKDCVQLSQHLHQLSHQPQRQMHPHRCPLMLQLTLRAAWDQAATLPMLDGRMHTAAGSIFRAVASVTTTVAGWRVSNLVATHVTKPQMCLEVSGPAVWQAVLKRTHPQGPSQSGPTPSVMLKVRMCQQRTPMDACRSAVAMLMLDMMTSTEAGTMFKAVVCATTTADGSMVMPLAAIQLSVR